MKKLQLMVLKAQNKAQELVTKAVSGASHYVAIIIMVIAVIVIGGVILTKGSSMSNNLLNKAENEMFNMF